jgi:hypothetical protein
MVHGAGALRRPRQSGRRPQIDHGAEERAFGNVAMAIAFGTGGLETEYMRQHAAGCGLVRDFEGDSMEATDGVFGLDVAVRPAGNSVGAFRRDELQFVAVPFRQSARRRPGARFPWRRVACARTLRRILGP